jgi:hypothetical protein
MATHNRFLSFFGVIVKALGGPHDCPQIAYLKDQDGAILDFLSKRLWSVGQIVLLHLEDHVQTAISYNLSMKEGSLFCFVVMRSTEPRCFGWFLGVFKKLSTRRGARAWFHDV